MTDDSPTPSASLLDQLVKATVASFQRDEASENHEVSAEEFDARLLAIAAEVIPRCATASAEETLAGASEHLAALRGSRAAFAASLRTMGGSALDSLEVLTDAFYDLGRDYLVAAAKMQSADPDYRRRALGSLHARACRTAPEILLLLEGGFADGAFARSRTLHEIAVVAAVLGRHGQAVAEAYHLHALVKVVRLMKALDQHQKDLRWAPVDEHELHSATTQLAALRRRFGPKFSGDYGWAEGAVAPLDPKDSVSLGDLERAVGVAHYRPFFTWASDAVHGGAKGLRSLGMPLGAPEILYSGGSTSGLTLGSTRRSRSGSSRSRSRHTSSGSIPPLKRRFALPRSSRLPPSVRPALAMRARRWRS